MPSADKLFPKMGSEYGSFWKSGDKFDDTRNSFKKNINKGRGEPVKEAKDTPY